MTDLTPNDLATILSVERRQYVIDYFEEHGEPARAHQLIGYVFRKQYGRKPQDSQDRKRVQVSLYQNHLPKLCDDGILAADRPSTTTSVTGRIELGENFETARDALDSLREVAQA